MTKEPEIDDNTPDISDAPPSSELEEAAIGGSSATGRRKKRSILTNIVDKLESKFCFR